MTTLRKLQAEIDRTIKSVVSGVEVFEQTFDKLAHTSNATQKEKLENDLKTQIKKLQRMRDQIKVWLGSSDIKDKTALMDNRRLIETQMERFKALEKEMKMKAFSKEGLLHASKLDPAEKARREMIDWVNNSIEELSRQTEATEAELETLTAGRKKKSGAERVSELEELNDRRAWHVGRLEIVQRMLENGSLTLEAVEGIQEDVKYFLESNTDEDFDYDTGIYDDLNLMDEEDFAGADYVQQDEQSLDSGSIADPSDVAPSTSVPAPSPSVGIVIAGGAPPHPKTPAKDDKAKPSGLASVPASASASGKKGKGSKDDESALAGDDAPASPTLPKRTTSRKSTMDSTKVEPPKKEKDAPPVPPVPSMIIGSTSTLVSTPTKAPLPPIRYAAAAAAAVAHASPAQQQQQQQAPPAQESSPIRSKAELPAMLAMSEPTMVNGHAPPPPPGLARASNPSTPQDQTHAPSPAPIQSQPPQQPAPGLSQSQILSPNGPTAGAPLSLHSHSVAQQAPSPAHGMSASPAEAMSPAMYAPVQQQPLPQPQHQGLGLEQGEAERVYGASGSGSASGSAMGSGSVPPPAPAPAPAQPPSRSQHQPGVMGSLMHSFDVAKDLADRRGNDVSQLHQPLETSLRDAPHQLDGEPPRYYHPKNPVKTPSYYPQTRSSAIYDKAVYDRLDQDTLFFLFYYYTGSYEQWLAARKLKEQNWRFHKQYLTWFKRAHQPQAITEDYEQGGYFYFDWENNWCQRKKSDFRFEYRWLSDQ